MSMSILNHLGLKSLSFSLRRLYCPVKKNALVLEVGSGGNPYPRANVLCDAYQETIERHFAPLVSDRPTVLGFAENLPFKDNSFDFVIASHVLEHSRNPEKFISELQRVAKAGYIETPDAFMERICPYPMHSLEVSENKGFLEIRKKTDSEQDPEISELFSHKASPIFPAWIKVDPYKFHVRYYWETASGGIKYKILNTRYNFDWPAPVGSLPAAKNKSARDVLVTLLRRLLSQNRRNRKINLGELLLCPNCKKGEIEINDGMAHE